VVQYPQFSQIAQAAADGRAQLLAHVDGEIAGLKETYKTELAMLTETRRALIGSSGGNGGGGSGGTVTAMKPTNGERTASRKRTRPSATKYPTTAAKPTTGAPSADAVLEAVRAGIGDQSPALARALGSTSETILRRFKELEAKGLLVRKGERANTRWVIAEPAAAVG
jgi:hypothetical protein